MKNFKKNKMSHNELVKKIVSECEIKGFKVKTEVELPKGKGAVDIACFSGKFPLFYAEVKSSPTSIRKKKVQKQLRLYEQFFGQNKNYILISPREEEIYVEGFNLGKIELKKYLYQIQ